MLTCSNLSIVIPTEDLTELILKGEFKKKHNISNYVTVIIL
jgi:hypothetical protein